jgi:Kef-type K+ transport system membrane component KefB
MDSSSLLASIAVVWIAGRVLADFAERFGQPSVVGEIFAGIIIGPLVLGVVQPNDLILALASLALMLQIFYAGTEVNLKHLLGNARPCFLIALFSDLAGIAVVFALMLLISSNWQVALLVAVALSDSSAYIPALMLQRMRKLHSRVGMLLMGTEAMENVLGIIAVTVLIALMSATSVLSLAGSVISLLVVLVMFAAASAILLPRIYSLSYVYAKPSTIFSVLLGIGLLGGYFAERVGLSALLGALLAGVLLSESPALIATRSRMLPVVELIAPLFAISIGMLVDLRYLFSKEALLLAAAAIAVKFGSSYYAATKLGFEKHVSVPLSIGLLARLEIAMFAASLGLNRGILGKEMYSALIGACIITILVTPFAFRLAMEKYG